MVYTKMYMHNKGLTPTKLVLEYFIFQFLHMFIFLQVLCVIFKLHYFFIYEELLETNRL